MKFRINISILFLTFFFENLCFSQDGIITNEELDRREQTAVVLLSEVTNLSESYAYLLTTRDTYLLGDKGVAETHKECFNGLNQWIQDWTPIFATIDLKGRLDSNTMQSQVQNMLTRQISQAENLKFLCTQIQKKAQTALLYLENAPKYNENILSQYRGALIEVEQIRNKLKLVLNNYISNPIVRVERIDSIIRLTKKSSSAKLRIELQKNAQISLQNSLAEFNSILEASKISDVALAKISTYEEQMNEYVLNLRYYSAKKLLERSNSVCNEQNDELNRSTVDKKYLKNVIARVNVLCNAIKEHFNGFEKNSLKAHELVYKYSRMINANIKIDCNTKIHATHCSKLTFLNSIKENSFKNFSAERLEFIENEWSKLYEDYKYVE